MSAPSYVYRASVVRVLDGDTALLDVDLGFHVIVRMSCRLAGINAIELHNSGGTEAREHLMSYLSIGDTVTVRSVKPDKYAGRFDGEIISSLGVAVSAAMVDDGYAAPWDGAGPKPVPPWPLPSH